MKRRLATLSLYKGPDEAMKRGEQVETLDGKHSGLVVAIFIDTTGKQRIVVDFKGALRIYAADELRVPSSSA